MSSVERAVSLFGAEVSSNVVVVSTVVTVVSLVVVSSAVGVISLEVAAS